MNTLIVYGTKYGCTENCAKSLSNKLNDKVDLFNLKSGNTPDLSNYDKIIIGGSVYMGKIQKKVTAFCSKNLTVLKEKKVGLFICCMAEGEAVQTQLNSCFPSELGNLAIAKENFGGEFIFKKMNFLFKMIVKKVSKKDEDISNILNENIEKFAQMMNKS